MVGQWFSSAHPSVQFILQAVVTATASGDLSPESRRVVMESGGFQINIFAVLGIDEHDLEWQDLAVCRGMPTNHFYDDYESDSEFAKVIDEACLSCPVISQCLMAGAENGEWGVWGGIYLVSGRKDDARNSHKTPEVWERIKDRVAV